MAPSSLVQRWARTRPRAFRKGALQAENLVLKIKLTIFVAGFSSQFTILDERVSAQENVIDDDRGCHISRTYLDTTCRPTNRY